ncbi:MAG: hypothetical protein K0R92_732 [Lachnospiraceae bacterium]|jgi:hypothetical protein|nr:hypothetical protein [Lachnospiraceae bacterium]
MKDNELVVNGFLFYTNKDYNDARQEQEAIDHFKSKLNLSNPQEALKLYNKILDKQSFRTPVGYYFLKELQESILASGVKSENIKGIMIPAVETGNSGYDDDMNTVTLKHYKELADTLKIRQRNSRIINIFLLFTILAMMVIAINTDKSHYANFENQVINKYEAWEEELMAKEQELEEREEKLNSLDK